MGPCAEIRIASQFQQSWISALGFDTDAAMVSMASSQRLAIDNSGTPVHLIDSSHSAQTGWDCGLKHMYSKWMLDQLFTIVLRYTVRYTVS